MHFSLDQTFDSFLYIGHGSSVVDASTNGRVCDISVSYEWFSSPPRWVCLSATPLNVLDDLSNAVPPRNRKPSICYIITLHRLSGKIINSLQAQMSPEQHMTVRMNRGPLIYVIHLGDLPGLIPPGAHAITPVPPKVTRQQICIVVNMLTNFAQIYV